MEWLLLIGFVLAVITLIGHGLWKLIAAILGFETLTQKPSAARSPNTRPQTIIDKFQIALDQITALLSFGLIDAKTFSTVKAALVQYHSKETPAVPVIPIATAFTSVSAPRDVVASARAIPIPFPPSPPIVKPHAVAPPPLPAAAPSRPRRSVAQVLGGFMEERNIRWGELAGGLLIVGCSIALVLSFWAEISQRPVFKFGFFTSVTAALFGLGLHSEHRWRLPTTSRGILIIATLLAPLNCLAFAALTPVGLPGAAIAVSDIISLIALTLLTWQAAKVIAPQWPGLLTLATSTLSASVLALRVFAPPAPLGNLLLALSIIPIGLYLIFSMSMLARARRWETIRASAATGILLTLGIFTFAAALALGLLVGQSASSGHPGLGQVLQTIAPVMSLGGLPALATGLLLRRRSTGDRLVLVRVGAAFVAAAGAMILLSGVGLAWPRPAALVPVALMDFLILTIVAIVCDIPIAHLLALPCLTIAWTVGFHVLAGHAAWHTDSADLFALLPTPITGTVLAPLALVVGAIAWIYSRAQQSDHRDFHWLVAALVALLTIILLNTQGFALAGDPSHATFVYASFATVMFAMAWRTEKPARIRNTRGNESGPLLRYSGGGLGWGPVAQDAAATQPPPQPSPGVPEEGEKMSPKVSHILAWIGWSLAGAAIGQYVLSHDISANPSSTALLIWASLAAVVYAALTRIPAAMNRIGGAGVAWLALGASAGALMLRLSIGQSPMFAGVPNMLLWLAGVWMIVAIGGKRPLIASAAMCAAASALFLRWLGPARDLAMFDVARLVDLNATVLALMALAAALRERVKARERSDSAAPSYIDVQLIVATVLAGLILVPAVIELVITPGHLMFAQVAGQFWGWLAIGSVVAASIVHGRLHAGQISIRAIALMSLTLVALCACTADDLLSMYPWAGFHVLMGGSLAVGWMILGSGILIAQRLTIATQSSDDAAPSDGQIALQYHRPAASMIDLLGARMSLVFGGEQLVPTVIRTVMLICGLVVLLAFRSLVGDPMSPWPAICGLAAVAGLLLALACWTFRAGLLNGATPLLNAAAAIWYFHANGIWHAGLAELLCINVAVVALSGLAWLVLDLNVLRRGQSESHHERIPPHGLNAIASIAAMCMIAGWLVFGRTIGSAQDFADVHLLTLAMASTALLAIARLWDRRAPRVLPTLYVVGLSAISLMLGVADLQPQKMLWTVGVWLAGYTLLTTILWSMRDALTHLAHSLGIATERFDGTINWLGPITMAAAYLIAGIAFWADFAFADPSQRFVPAVAALAQGFALLLLTRGNAKTALRQHCLQIVALAAVAIGWAIPSPSGATPAQRVVIVFMIVGALSALYRILFHVLLKMDELWEIVARQQAAQTAIVAIIALAFAFGSEVFDIATIGHVTLDPISTFVILIALIFAVGGMIWSAARNEEASIASHQRLVYAAEGTLVLIFAHLRMTMPFLFGGWLSHYWPLVMMAIAFSGASIGELFRRREQPVFAQPLHLTGIFLPILPIIALLVGPPTPVNLEHLLLLSAGLYGVVAAWRRSFGFAVLAALCANGAFWHLLAFTPGFGFLDHPQVWLIPLALAVLIASQLNSHRMGADELRTIRYTCLLTIYCSSTADIFLNGVAIAPWLPLVLAVLSLAGVLVGVLHHIRPFLYLGITFLSLSILTMIYYASAELHWTWIWYVAGIALGAGMIALFALFEKRRSQMVSLIEGMRGWE